jgi:outer membrane protein assembly factor BamB
MHRMRFIHTLLTLGISSLFLTGLFVYSSHAGFQTYPDDGIWEDTFDDNDSVTLTNCAVKGGEIVLDQELSQISYNFNQNNQLAYAFQSFFFFPLWKYFSPKRHIPSEVQFASNDVYKIKNIDDYYAERSSKGILFSYVAHHFRFKVGLDPDTVDYLSLHWYGKADSKATVAFYYYNSSYMVIGGWELLGRNGSTGDDFSVNHRIHGGALEHALDGNDYIDILVISSIPFRVSTLYTNYVEVVARTQKGYSLDDATAVTKSEIVPYEISDISKNDFYWELLTWDDYQPTGTKARYHVLYKNTAGNFVEVEDSVLPGNHKGFQSSPVVISNLSNYEYRTSSGPIYGKLKIRVNFSTTNPAVSPRIFNWALTWQNKSRWKDSFNTFYRIDSRSKVSKENGSIIISSIQDEWPIFGFDTANTRASSGKGASSNNLYWFSAEYVGGDFRNPVVGNGNVYIASDSRTVHQFPVVLETGAEEGAPLRNASLAWVDADVVNSPAVTDDVVIVATGQQAQGGALNYIYGFDYENLSAKWPRYDYSEKICYDSSPVVDGSSIYITTWGGDNGTYVIEANRYTNNKLLALHFDVGSGIQSVDEYELPAPSYSSPAVLSDKIIVTCHSTDNNSVIALSRDSEGHIGEKLWGKSIGAVGHAAPVVSGDTVFVTCASVTNKKYATKIVALSLNDGTILWNRTLGTPSSSYSAVAESTPAVNNGVVFVASAGGTVYALDSVNGTVLWSREIYTVPLFSEDVLRSSPAYAENRIYVGTPNGLIYGLDASSGTSVWDFETFPIWTAAPVYGSPAVSNGLVFLADENGVLYSLGRFTTSTKQVSGRIISVPIHLPEALWWGNFYADVSVLKDVSSVTFKLLDENGNVLNANLVNKSSLTQGGLFLDRTVRLQADFSSSNLSKSNPKLLRWYVTLTSDTQKPFLNSSSFTPSVGGWLQQVVPEFTIKVKDNGTGLRVKSGVYTLKYTVANVSQQTTAVAVCTGTNGTTAWQTLTMNISLLPDFENITSLRSLTFNITDLAGNKASKTVTFKQDVKKPTSHIKTQLMKKKYNTSYVRINATANDTGTLGVDASGISVVELYYRYSTTPEFSGNWVYFDNSTKTQPTWKFNFTNKPNQNGGYFELCTIAIDKAGNTEDFPTNGDVWFLYDWRAPSLPSVSGETLWFNELPQFSVVFEDDFRLDTIQYRPNFETLWTTIASHVNASVYNTDSVGKAWILKEDYWDMMIEDEIYYLYFRINDTLGNTVTATSNSNAIIIRKDVSPPIINIDVPAAETEWTWDENFTISGLGNDRNGSGIKEAVLYYRFSEDKSNWSSWTAYGTVMTSSSFEWQFDADEGDGYYEVRIDVVDYAGNSEESAVFPIAVASFPTTLALVLVGLVVILIVLSVGIYIKWRKKK